MQYRGKDEFKHSFKRLLFQGKKAPDDRTICRFEQLLETIPKTSGLRIIHGIVREKDVEPAYREITMK